jgi:signal transduction histidine kinase/ligand-binding sensor domain-containing protein/DNA-binding NarL/FixJ family response regulator
MNIRKLVPRLPLLLQFARVVTAATLGSRLTCVLLIVAYVWQLAIAQTAVSEGQRIIHENWTFRDGAPEGVEALAQTTDGFLWLGAPAGLVHFDGNRFEPFRSPFGDQLMSTAVHALFGSPTGGLWVGYLYGGFSFVKNGRVINFADTASLTGAVNGFAQDRHGIVWAATIKGLWRFDGSSWQQMTAEWNAPPGHMAQVGFDRDGILWALALGTEMEATELFYLPPESRQFRKAGNVLVANFTWDADHTVVTTHELRPRERGSRIDLENSLPAYPILRKDSGQFVDRTNGIWLTPVHDPFVMRYPAIEPLTESISKASPRNSEIYQVNPNQFAMLVDREGNVWFGDRTGVHRFSYSPVIKLQLPKENPYFALAPDAGGVVWIVAGNYESSILYRVAADKDQEKSRENVQHFAYRARDNTLWFGGQAGLWHMVNGSLTRVDFPHELADKADRLQTITEDRSGGMWVSFGLFGLYRYANGVWTPYGSLRDLPPGALIAFSDKLGRVWFGYPNGRLALVDGARVQVFGPSDGIRVGNITAIYGRGPQVWIGGEFGLQQFDDGRFHTITSVDEELLRGISGIVETANGDLWLNGLGGIFHVRRAEIMEGLKKPAYKVSGERFGRRDGVPGIAFQLQPLPTAIEGTDGRLWFTVMNGVVWLDPTRASNKTPPPPVSIQSVSADDKAYVLGQSLRFPARTSNIQISYAAVSLLNPEAIHFRYKLQETDKEWHVVATSTPMSYRNLPPGLYHFVVNASDSNGIWSDKNAIAEFTILPAFYQTNWFRILCAAMILAFVGFGYRWRIRAIEKRNRDLALQVKERTAELEVSKEKAEAANNAKSAFLASVSHDLRTPLNGILGYAQILKKSGLTEKQQSGLDVIEQSGDHLLTLINDILELSRIEAGKLELNPADVHVPSFLSGIADIVRIKAEQKSLQFVLAAARDLPEGVCADERRLRQVLLNLLDNAVKFTDHGKVVLQIDMLGTSDSGARLRFEVSDTGVGMSPEQLGRVFQPFVQVGEVCRRTAGMGLGLAICRRLVTLMGGDIQVRSEQGQGTAFWFELILPIMKAAAKLPGVELAVGYTGPRKKVLVVDDVPANRAVLTDFLSTLGFKIAEADNGKEGLKRASEFHPDLILMDGVMPVMDGLEATRALRLTPVCEALPIIGISASASGSDAAAFLAAGANAFLTKPIAFPRLLAEMGTLMKIAWVYESRGAESGKTGIEEELVLPQHEELAILHELAVFGDMSKIDERAEYLAALDERYRPLASRLHRLAVGFQSQAILALIVECMAREHANEPISSE